MTESWSTLSSRCVEELMVHPKRDEMTRLRVKES
jgi:hypothetical protein